LEKTFVTENVLELIPTVVGGSDKVEKTYVVIPKTVGKNVEEVLFSS